MAEQDEIVEIMARLWWEESTQKPQVPWPNLHDVMRDYAYEQARKMLSALAAAGYSVVPAPNVGEPNDAPSVGWQNADPVRAIAPSCARRRTTPAKFERRESCAKHTKVKSST